MSGTILINPPFLDPTLPPHFAAYLVGAARQAGCADTVAFEDCNISLLNWILTPAAFDLIRAQLLRLITRIDACSEQTLLERLTLRYALQIVGIDSVDIVRSKKILTNTNDFYNFGKYRGAASLLSRYVNAISALSLPGLFRFWDIPFKSYFNLSRISDLSDGDFCRSFTGPFEPFFANYVNELVSRKPGVVAISCNYISQLPFSISILKAISAASPHISLCVGGTEVTDIFKNIGLKSDLWRIFPHGTIIVIGEGESAFSEIVLREKAGNIRNGYRYENPNIVTETQSAWPQTGYVEDINAIGAPAYDIFKLNDYLAPEPVLMYSPTRGCYWNKCTFCDYGLNFGSPTSPSRQRSAAALTSDLELVSRFSRTVYLAVDAIAPSYLRRIAEEIARAGYSLSWSAEIRLERYISRNSIGDLLRKGGCVALSFGYESGSQRILDAINKGVNLQAVPQLLSDLSGSGIHSQLMGFIGFPTETLQEADATFRFLMEHRGLWSLCGIGSFVLTPGALVAQNKGAFGIRELIATGDEIVRAFRWYGDDCRLVDGSRNDAARDRYSAMLAMPLSRPFAGGIDTAHSILYFREFRTQRAFRELIETEIEWQCREAIYQLQSDGAAGYPQYADVFSSVMMSKPTYRERRAVLDVRIPVSRKPNKVYIKESGNVYIDNRAELPQWIVDMYV